MATLIAAAIAQLRRHAPFDGMEEADIELLASRLKLAYFPAETVILESKSGVPAHVYIIKQGAVVVGPAQRETGPELALQEGECFPLGAMVADRAVSGMYRASHDTFCYELAAADFRDVMRRSAAFHNFCTQRIAHMLEHALGNLRSDMALNTSRRQPLDRTLDQIVQRPPVSCVGSASIRDALAVMERDGVGSMLVTRPDGTPGGIFTLKDLLARVALKDMDLSQPISAVMTANPVSMQRDAFAYEAAIAMSEHGIHHLVVMDGAQTVGVISEKDLFAMQRIGLRQVGAAIGEAGDVETLAHLADDIREMTRTLLAQGVDAEHLVRILASLNDRLCRRVIQLDLAGAPIATHEFCWIALGSEGRNDRTLTSDQDNGIIFAEPEGGDREAARARLLPVAQRINKSLARVGFSLCRGNIMAGNPQWCLSEDEWRANFSHWIAEGDPAAILHATIFFDFRATYGNGALADRLREWLALEVRGNERFLRKLSENALANRPPLGIVRDFTLSDDKVHPNTIDLKVNGATLFTDAARVYALANGVTATHTVERLQAAAQCGAVSQSDADMWVAAINFLQHFRLRNQHAQISRGEQADNYLQPDRLNALDRRLLKETLRTARNLQQRLALDYQLWGR